MTRPLGPVSLATESVRLLARHAGFLLPLAFAPSLALALVNLAVGLPTAGTGVEAASSAPGAAAMLLALAANAVVGLLLTGVMCLAALDGALGKRHRVGAYLRQTLRHAPAVIVLGLLLSIAVGLGVVLLVLPGLYLAARWLPWTQATLFEDLGWSGVGRAEQLTAGLRWPLVGAILVMAAVVAVLLVAAGQLFLLVGDAALPAALVEAAASAIYYGLVASFTACAYLRLREIQDGLDAAAVAATID